MHTDIQTIECFMSHPTSYLSTSDLRNRSFFTQGLTRSLKFVSSLGAYGFPTDARELSLNRSFLTAKPATSVFGKAPALRLRAIVPEEPRIMVFPVFWFILTRERKIGPVNSVTGV